MTAKENIARIHELRGRQKATTLNLQKSSDDIQLFHDLQLAIEEASVVLQDVAKESQEKVKVQLASLVTKALTTIYPEEPYTFLLKFVSERGQTSVYPTLVLNGNELDPMDNSGGMAEVIAFALRIALIAIGKKPKLLILDEPFTGISALRIPLVHEFIQQMSEDLHMQFVITTHLDGLMEDADKSFIVLKDGEQSRVRVV
jgi:DNA repair exonuclease SbcCD ATPase subunit